MCSICGPALSRRGLLVALSAAGLAGCSENAATGRRQLVGVSDAQLSRMASASWTQIEARTPEVRDPAIQARLARIGRPLAEAARRPDLDWSFTVLDSPDLNAFVLPNGRVGFFRGLLDLTRSDDEIGAVLGHEIGHILARHPAERVSHQLAARVGVGVAQLLVANSENAEFADEVGAALGLGAQFGVILPYARQHELEADRVGVGLMQKADMDPAAALTFWERMSRAGRSENRPPEVLSTHPADDRRIAALRSAVAGLPTRRNAG
jgi:predicted Zn-dependent protease